MFNSSLHLRVPVTVRPIGMLGGGAASSKDGLSAEHNNGSSSGSHRHGRGGTRSQAGFASPSPSTSVSPASGGYTTTSTAASPAHAKSNFSSSPGVVSPAGHGSSAMMATPTTTGSTMDESPPPVSRPTITIFTELEDEEEEEGMGAARPWLGSTQDPLHASRGYRDPTADLPGGGGDAGLGAVPPPRRKASVLKQTETTLSPLHYQSICNHPNGEEGIGMSASSFDMMGGQGVISSSNNALPYTEGSEEVRTSDRSSQPAAAAPFGPAAAAAITPSSSNGIASSTTSHGPPPLPSSQGWPMGGGTPPDPHPVRISATPVVPIVPHVVEPSSRKRVADDLERLYGPNGQQQQQQTASPSAAPAAEGPLASSQGPTASPAAVAAPGTSPPGAETATATAASLPPETPKKKKSALSFLSGSSSSKKAAKAAAAAAEAEAKRKAAPPTAAEKRLAREQVIRVGVQRLYQRLNELHLVVYHVKNDGNCQFRAISHQLFGNEDYHDIIRSQVVSYMRAARAECFDFYFESPAQADAYYDNLAKPGSWGDELSLRAASDCLYVNIHVLSSEERNCYITYRPAIDRAAYAPSFLIDIAKLRERRRAERRLLRAHGLHGGPSSSMTSYEPSAMSYRGASTTGGDYSGFGTGAATMPDTYNRGRSAAPSAFASTAAPTLLTPGNASPAAASAAGAAGRGSAMQNCNNNCCSPGSRFGSQVPLTPLMPGSQLMSRDPSGLLYDGDDEGDDDGEVDANAIQLALHKKLQQSEIRCSLPVGATAATASSSFSPSMSHNNNNNSTVQTGNNVTLAGHGLGATSMPLLQPQRGMLSGGPPATGPLLRDSGTAGCSTSSAAATTALLRPVDAAVPSPRLVSGDEDLTQGPKANQVERFRAVGAEVQCVDDATQRVKIFTQRMEQVPSSGVGDGSHEQDYVRLRQTSTGMKLESPPPPMLSRGTLLQPQRSNQAEPAALLGGGLAGPHTTATSCSDNTNNNLLRNRPEPLMAAMTAPVPAHASSSSMPFMTPQSSMRLTEEPGEMMLLASNAHRTNPSLQQSFSFMQTANSYGNFNSSTTNNNNNNNPMLMNNGGSSLYAESFNANPMHGSFSHSFAGGPSNAYAQSLGNLVPVPSSEGHTPLHGGMEHSASAFASGSDAPVGFFRFEPRTEPIDIFLSYLFPVHYNSLSVSQPQGVESMNTSTATMPASALSNPSLAPATGAASAINETPQLIPPSLSGNSTAARYQM